MFANPEPKITTQIDALRWPGCSGCYGALKSYGHSHSLPSRRVLDSSAELLLLVSSVLEVGRHRRGPTSSPLESQGGTVVRALVLS